MTKTRSALIAHILALVTAFAWGSSFIASKILLNTYTPTQVMLMRFILAYLALWLCRPKLLCTGLRDELLFAALAVSGCTLYFLCENSALTHTYAANVSIIVAAAPILTAIAAHFFIPGERLSAGSFAGFAAAFLGVALVVFNGTVVLKLSPVGDLLSLGAALCWAVYSVLLRKTLDKFDTLLLTRRLMLWGMITALPLALLEGAPLPLAPLLEPGNLVCILFLSFVCSALGYVFWNMATARLGTVVVVNYVYIIPFFTMLTGVLVLGEPLTAMGIVGAVLIMLGMIIADRKKS